MHKPMFDASPSLLPARGGCACLRWRRALAAALLAGSGWLALMPAAHADLWAYVDEFGVTHFAAEALDERYKLLFKGELYDSSQPGLQLKPDSAAQGLSARTRMQSFFEVSPRYKSVRPHLQKAAERTGVDYDLIKAVIAVESGFDAQAVSPKGAVGLMQLMPATAERFGVAASKKRSLQQQLVDPAVNVPAGARYLSYLMDLFPGRLDLVLAAYNAGEGAVQKFGKAIPPYKETMNYVKAVTGIYEQLQAARPRSGRLAAAGSAGRGGSRIRMTLPGAAPAAADAQIP
ncbi:lytic transglycosylase domain-containing protein [Comamonas testosteroni]|uniref:lytic transglycosylase domain-containing protein n=1 Tax=Comamonas testosteroni TaxID=285 RepID=UPI002DB93E82|nr:lytic transglycosylase domain-containing protein [Comamonas testosteroni]MEB5965380.1 lytic transglycosylase domain-containing protein [Comamonas testosteroni]